MKHEANISSNSDVAGVENCVHKSAITFPSDLRRLEVNRLGHPSLAGYQCQLMKIRADLADYWLTPSLLRKNWRNNGAEIGELSDL